MTEAIQENVPVLRFPEFRANLEKTRLENIADLIGGFAFSSSIMTSQKTSFQLVKMSNLYGGTLNLNRNTSYLDKIGPSEKRFCIENNDILISLTGTVGKRDFGYTVLVLEPIGLYLNQRVGLLRVKKDVSVAVYLSAVTKTHKFQKQFHSLAIGGTGNQANVSLVDCRKLTIPFPSLSEQQKIASFLSSVDEKIERLTRKKELLEQYKKGMMQKIFSQEFRFKDDNGNPFPDWEQKRIEEVADCLDNKRKPLNSTERASIQGCFPYYGANGQLDSINRYIFDEPIVLLAEDGGNFDEFANRPIAQNIVGKCWVNNHAHILRAKLDVCIHEFLFQSLVHKDIRKYINGSSRAKLNKSDMMTINCGYPHPNEQQKIADFLSSLDAKIDLVANELSQAQAFKKGLLQQMFV